MSKAQLVPRHTTFIPSPRMEAISKHCHYCCDSDFLLALPQFGELGHHAIKKEKNSVLRPEDINKHAKSNNYFGNVYR